MRSDDEADARQGDAASRVSARRTADSSILCSDQGSGASSWSPFSLLLHLPVPTWAKAVSTSPEPTVWALTAWLSQARKQPDPSGGRRADSGRLGRCPLFLLLRSSSLTHLQGCKLQQQRDWGYSLGPSLTPGVQPSPWDCPHARVITASTIKPPAAAWNLFSMLPTSARSRGKGINFWNQPFPSTRPSGSQSINRGNPSRRGTLVSQSAFISGC